MLFIQNPSLSSCFLQFSGRPLRRPDTGQALIHFDAQPAGRFSKQFQKNGETLPYSEHHTNSLPAA
jgi:hypothetical protein